MITFSLTLGAHTAAMNTATILDLICSAPATCPSTKILAMSLVITLLAKISTMVNTVAKILFRAKRSFSGVLVEFIGTVLHLLLTPCVLGESITEGEGSDSTHLVPDDHVLVDLGDDHGTDEHGGDAPLGLFSHVSLAQHKDLGDELGDHLLGGDQHDGENSGKDHLQRKGVFSKGLDEVIATFLHLVLTSCILGESIISAARTQLSLELDSASVLTRPRT